jgi:hypothetical protein
LLTVLSCYLQVVSIYDAIFTHVLVQLAPMPESVSSMLQGSSGLFFTGYPPMQDGVLIRLLVQVVEHQLELVERAIGLPQQYRVSTSGHIGTGLFSAHEGKALLNAVVGSTFDGSDDRSDLRAVASLRDNLRRAQQ